MSLRERIQQKGLPEVVLTIDGDKYLVKGLTRSKRSELIAASRDGSKTNTAQLEGKLLSNCVYDSESAEPLFSEDEWTAWDSLPACITAPLFAEVMKLNGLDNDDVGREVKNSGPTGN